jgi:hypothetical protein
MAVPATKPVAPQPTLTELFQRYSKKERIVHRFAENLAQTLGVFHGLNETAKKLKVDGEAAQALETVLFDQLQIMVIRVCALCDDPRNTRKDDAALVDLVRGLSEPSFQQFLIAKEKQWERAVGYRAGTVGEIPKQVRALKSRWTVLSAEDDALARIRHFRSKALAHATTGHDPSRTALVGDVWRVSRLALSVAKYARLLLQRQEWNYLAHSADGRARGRALVRALHHAARSS